MRVGEMLNVCGIRRSVLVVCAAVSALVPVASPSAATSSVVLRPRAALAGPVDSCCYGQSVAVSGPTAVVGTLMVGGAEPNTVDVYARVDGAWTKQAALSAPDGAPIDMFGRSVAISGGANPTIVVGAPQKDDSAGAVYVYTRSNGVWSLQAELLAPDRTPGDRLGDAVAISGSTIVASADARNSYQGAVFVFARTGSTWTQQAELTSPARPDLDAFGRSVAITGTTVIVGAAGADDPGAAYLYARSRSSWALQATLHSPGAPAADDFGYAVALTGSASPTAVIGARGAGVAYVYTRAGSVWSQQAMLSGSVTGGFGFGSSVAASGDRILVGGAQNSQRHGIVYAFLRTGYSWAEEAQLTQGGRQDAFGASVAVSGTRAFAGAPRNTTTGTAFFYRLPAT
jgi:hypothetical protein